VKARDTVLVFGATGAVGSLAVQFAKRHGARVVGTGRGKDAVEFIRKLGADKAVDLKRKDAVEQIREFAPNGLDAALALAGGNSLQQLLKLVRPGGRIAYPNGVEPQPKSQVKLVSYDAEAGPKQFERLNQAVEEAKLKAPIAAVFSLEQAAKAHARVEKGHLFGRIALRIRSDKRASARSR
jgi:NADPH:quinone reductase-like Zn-dependent oxidoreductase